MLDTHYQVAHMPTTDQIIEAIPVILSLILIEGLLSVDNALAIASMASHLPPNQQKLALRLGIIGAYAFRGLCLIFVVWIQGNLWIKYFGATYLIYLMCSHLTHEEPNPGDTHKIHTRSLWMTVASIELMDLSLSIDNVIAAVALSNQLWVIITGVFIGILALRLLAGYAIGLIKRNPVLGPTAFVLVGYVGCLLLFEMLTHQHLGSVGKFSGICLILVIALLYEKFPAWKKFLDPIFRLTLAPMRAFSMLVGSLFWPFKFLIGKNAGSRAMSTAPFAAELLRAIEQNQFQRLILSRPTATELRRNIYLRPIKLVEGHRIQMVHRFATHDDTENIIPSEVPGMIQPLLGNSFLDAHLETFENSISLRHSRKGVPHLSRKKLPSAAGSVVYGHDRVKSRLLNLADLPWLHDLGLTDTHGRILPSRSAKWRQVERFIELIDHAWRDLEWPADRPVKVCDMGCGKGYLTFAIEAWLTDLLKVRAEVYGIEQRVDLVSLCNRLAEKYQRQHLRFLEGQIGKVSLTCDVLIALHACNTATDDALALGIRNHAAMIVCAPCCQHELRGKMTATDLTAGLLGHGLLLQRQAALLTDALRALILEREGYQVRVVEFVSTEHTDKNLLLIATQSKRKPGAAQQKMDALKSLFGIDSFHLESLLS